MPQNDANFGIGTLGANLIRAIGVAGGGEEPGLDYSDILYAADSGIATITINRPDMSNAVRPRTYEELTHAMTQAANDPTVGVVVLTGAGDKAFCAGGDIRDQSARNPNVGRIHMRRLFALSSVMRSMDKPIVAKVRGFCVGGGNEINLFCDMTIASDDAKFGQTGPRVGSVPIWGACQLLARYVGERKAREMVFTCRLYTAQQALEMGLINEVCPAAELDAVVARDLRRHSVQEPAKCPDRKARLERGIGPGVLFLIFSERRASGLDLRKRGEHGRHQGLPRKALAQFPTLPQMTC